jgi:hypothetical protein
VHPIVLFLRAILSRVEQVAEKGLVSGERLGMHASGDKSPSGTTAFVPGLKTPAYRPIEFLRSL